MAIKLLLRRHAPVVILAALAALGAVAVHILLLPNLSRNGDESVYLLQAETLLQGRLTLPAAAHDAFFRPWLTGEHDGQLFTKYLPGWPGLLAGSLLISGSPLPALALAAAGWVLAVYALAYELFGRRRLALLAAGITVASPIFVLQTPVLLSYAIATALLLAGATGWIRGTRLGRPLIAAAGGAALGLAFLIRSYDVLLIGAPVAAYLLVTHRSALRQAARGLAWTLAGAVPFLGVALAYNAAVTGSPLRMPLPATEPLDRFGFGPRRMMATAPVTNYTPERAVESTLDLLARMPQLLFGGLLLLAVAAYGALARERRPQRLLLVALIAAFPACYFFFWGSYLATRVHRTGGTQYYYVPAFGPLAVLAAAGADRLLERLLARPRRLAVPVLTALAVTACLISVPDARAVLRWHREADRRAEALLTLVPPQRQLPTPAVVLLTTAPGRDRYIGNPYQFLRNDPQLRNPVLYAASQGVKDNRLADVAPGRAQFALRPNELHDAEHPEAGRGRLVPLDTVRGPQLRVEADVTVPASGRCVVAYLLLRDQPRQDRLLTCAGQAGQRHTVSWTLGGPGGLPLPQPGADATVVVGVAVGDSPNPKRAALWETRNSLGVRGAAPAPTAVLQYPGPAWRRPGATARWAQSSVDSVLRLRVSPVGAAPATPSAG